MSALYKLLETYLLIFVSYVEDITFKVVTSICSAYFVDELFNRY